jgi:hypothetical protein
MVRVKKGFNIVETLLHYDIVYEELAAQREQRAQGCGNEG